MPIYSYKNTAGQTLWRVIYNTPDHRQLQKRGFKRKLDAKEFLNTIEASKMRGEYIDLTAGKLTIKELGDTWLGTQTHLKPSSFHGVEVAYRLHVLPVWGDIPISAIRHSKVQAWVSDLSSVKSPTTVIRAFGVLAAILDTAVKDRRILENPARGVKLPKKVRKPRAYLTHSQVTALAEASRQHSTLVYMLAYTGLRWGEATALKVSSLDFLKKSAYVTENAVTVNGKIHVGTPKTHEARRVPIPSFLLPMLNSECTGKSKDSLVFGDGVNHLRQPSSRDGWFESAVKRCQAEDSDFPRVTPHDLRHTAASLSISAGANVKAVQKMLGHASATMTLDTYADLFEDDLNSVADALDRDRVEKNLAKILPKPIVQLREEA